MTEETLAQLAGLRHLRAHHPDRLQTPGGPAQVLPVADRLAQLELAVGGRHLRRRPSPGPEQAFPEHPLQLELPASEQSIVGRRKVGDQCQSPLQIAGGLLVAVRPSRLSGGPPVESLHPLRQPGRLFPGTNRIADEHPRTDPFHDKEGVTLRLTEQELPLPGIERPLRHRLAQRRRIFGPQGPEFDLSEPNLVPPEGQQQIGQGVVGVHLFQPGGPRHEQRRRRLEAEQVVEPLQRIGIAPLKVIEHQDAHSPVPPQATHS